jgi:glycerol-3-phosphate dehydrogenase
MWERVAGDFDLLVIGGGINGAGIARDAARRGLRVLLAEQDDLASGTSSRSTKLVHGGLRYLEQLELSLVFEAVSERRTLMDIAPHLVNPLGFLFPVFQESRQNLTTLRAGMWLYDGLSLFRSPKLHRTLTPKEVAQEEPLLRGKGLTGAPLFYDCSTDDARLTLENALDAARLGAVIVTHAKVVGFRHDERGRLCGAELEDQSTKDRRPVGASAMVNATGPWTDRTLDLSRPLERALLRPTKGVHIVVPADRLAVQHAVVCFHPDDGRVLFAIPWKDATYIGTTDTDWSGDPAKVAADSADVDYLIQAANAYFPTAHLTRQDVLSTWAGLRPLMRPVGKEGVSESAVSREHQVVVSPDGLITIAGGKLTTYRKIAEEVVDTAVRLLRLSGRITRTLPSAHTDRDPLPGAVGWPADDDHDRVAARITEVAGPGLSPVSARHLADTLGMRGLELARWLHREPRLLEPLVPGRPEVLGQVAWAVEEELAATVSDVLMRRTQLYFRDTQQGLGAARRVADEMQRLLGWTEEQLETSIRDYEAEVALSRAWKVT